MMGALAGIWRALFRIALWLMFIVAAAFLGTGAYSYWRGIPENAIWIGYEDLEPRFQMAMVRGTLHAVCSKPLSGRQWIPKSEKKLGPFYFREAQIGIVHAWGGGVPFWGPAALLLVCPAIALMSGPIRRRRRRKRGECVKCGYNLTGLPEPRCPECGTVFVPKPCPVATTEAPALDLHQ